MNDKGLSGSGINKSIFYLNGENKVLARTIYSGAFVKSSHFLLTFPAQVEN